MSKNDDNKKDCCGGQVGTDCQCGFIAEDIFTEEEKQAMQMLRIILEHGRKERSAKQKLYDDMLADADLTNI